MISEGIVKKKGLIVGAVVAAGVIGAVMLLLQSRRDGDSALLLSGTIEVTEVNLGFKTAGRVAEMLVEEGAKVGKGQRIAVLDQAEIRSIVDQNRAAVKYSEAVFEKARKDLDRATHLARDEVISAQQMDAAGTTYDVARSQLQQARAALDASEVRLRDTVLLSPTPGTVLQKVVEAGETVPAGATVYSIGDLDAPWVKVYVNETKLGAVRLGQHAQVRVDSYPKRIFEGTVTQINSEAEFTPKHIQTQEERVKLVYGVKVSVRNEGDVLKPGMPADVAIQLK